MSFFIKKEYEMRRGKKTCMTLATAALLGLLGTGAAFSAQYDTVYYGGKIYTMSEKEELKDLDPARAKIVDVVAVKDGVIVYAGDRAGIDLEQATNKIDLKGKTMLPGFADGHGHAHMKAMQDLYQVFLGSAPSAITVGKSSLFFIAPTIKPIVLPRIESSLTTPFP